MFPKPLPRPRRSRCLAALALLCALALPTLAIAGKKDAKSCSTAKCHAEMQQQKYVHGPAASGDCRFCHKETGKHRFAPIANVGAVCNECHAKMDSQQVVHDPVKSGECDGCHDSHGSPFKYQLRAEGAKLCFLCHDQELAAGRYAHGPVALGSCSTCHNVHQSDYPKMLLAQGNDVCYACHSDKEEEFQTKKFVHEPVETGCIDCHDAHSSNYPYSLAGEPTQGLCFTCHSDKEEEVLSAGVKHGGLALEKKCLACHTPHISNYPKQLTMEPMDLCLSCHDRVYDDGNGSVKTADIQEMLKENRNHHGPIGQQDCSGCHNTHGSDNFRILRGRYPPLFYASYNTVNYELCYQCHENTLAAEEFTQTLTGFRNGRQNLHYVHVNQTKKGRTCRACHDAHATNNPKHLRDAVPFGAWSLPVGFTPTKNGGTCFSGCHQIFSYDRVRKVKNR